MTPYIVIDGPDGCGKTTQIGLLKERSKREARDCIFTREPGGTMFAEIIREILHTDVGANISPVTQFQIMWGVRRDHLEKVVWQKLEEGTPVISDRGDSSTFAYQVHAKNTLFLEAPFWTTRKLIFAGHEPSLYIYIDVPTVMARSRVQNDGSMGKLSGFDAESVKFYGNVRKGFSVFGDNPDVKMIIVGGTRSREEIHNDIYQIVSKACGW